MAKPYGLANQKLCYIQIYLILEEKTKEYSWEWLVNTDPGLCYCRKFKCSRIWRINSLRNDIIYWQQNKCDSESQVWHRMSRKHCGKTSHDVFKSFLFHVREKSGMCGKGLINCLWLQVINVSQRRSVLAMIQNLGSWFMVHKSRKNVESGNQA